MKFKNYYFDLLHLAIIKKEVNANFLDNLLISVDNGLCYGSCDFSIGQCQYIENVIMRFSAMHKINIDNNLYHIFKNNKWIQK